MPSTQMSNQVSRCLITAQVTLDAGETHLEAIASKIADRNQGFDKETAEKTIHGLLNILKDETEKLRKAELAYVQEKADDNPLRHARDMAAQTLLETLQRTKNFLKSAMDPQDLKNFGLAGRFPKSPQQLTLFTQNVIHLFQSFSQNSGPFQKWHENINLSELVNTLSEKVEPLEQTLSKLGTELQTLKRAQNQRDLALESWRKTYHSVARALEAFYLLADEPVLAQWIRPTAKKVHGREVLSKPETSPQTAAQEEQPSEQ